MQPDHNHLGVRKRMQDVDTTENTPKAGMASNA